MGLFADAVLNWDEATQGPRIGGGIFGFTKAYFASVESQNSTGDLHNHMLVWVHGMPSTVGDYYRLIHGEEFKLRLARYVKSIATASAPVTSSTQCPQCKSFNLAPVSLRQSDYQRARRNAVRPTTAVCTACLAEFGGTELLDGLVASAVPWECRKKVESAQVFRSIVAATPLPRPEQDNDIYALVMTKALLTFQNHRWFHSKSCFKKTRRTPNGRVCRMFFPKPPVEQTGWSSNASIELERRCGNEYVNDHIPLIAQVFKTNHDVKFLGAGEGAFIHILMS
jgi:hypothetical protein